MTDRREERRIKLQQLKDGKLEPKQKADFYFKMAKIVERELGRLDEITDLLEIIPESYLKKIDSSKASISAMKLTERLVEATDPSPYASRDAEGKYHVFRHFRLDLKGSLPRSVGATVGIDLVYEPTDAERLLFSRLIDHIVKLQEIYQNNESPFETFTPAELKKKIDSIVKGREYVTQLSSVTAVPSKEIGEAILFGTEPTKSDLPEFSKIKLNSNDPDTKEGAENSK